MSLIVGSSRDGSNTLGILRKFVLMTNKNRKKRIKRKEKKYLFLGVKLGRKKSNSRDIWFRLKKPKKDKIRRGWGWNEKQKEYSESLEEEE